VPLRRYSLSELTVEVANRLPSEEVTPSRTAIWRLLTHDALRPWRYRSWIFPRDRHFLELAGPVLDAVDGANLTPTGAEGPGVVASPGCEVPTLVYRDLAGADHASGTLDDDPTPASGSPLIDRGLDPRTLLTPDLNPRFEADYPSWPVPGVTATPWYLGARGTLVEAAPSSVASGQSGRSVSRAITGRMSVAT